MARDAAADSLGIGLVSLLAVGDKQPVTRSSLTLDCVVQQLDALFFQPAEFRFQTPGHRHGRSWIPPCPHWPSVSPTHTSSRFELQNLNSEAIFESCSINIFKILCVFTFKTETRYRSHGAPEIRSDIRRLTVWNATLPGVGASVDERPRTIEYPVANGDLQLLYGYRFGIDLRPTGNLRVVRYLQLVLPAC